MFQKLKKWWNGENIEVSIVGLDFIHNTRLGRITLIELPDKLRRYVYGHLGTPGEKITVNTWDIKKF